MKKIVYVILIALLFMGLPAQAAKAPLRVVASFSILADMAEEIGGDAVTVTSLVGRDRDAHAYEPTPQDVQRLAKADLILINGLGFEGWMQRLIEASGTHAKVIVVSTGVPTRMMDTSGAVDPHAWQDIANGRIYTKNIAAALEQALPGQAAILQARADRYDAALESMDRSIRKQFAEIPPAQRKVITSHNSFTYFGAAYGVTFLAPVGLNTESEPSAADLAKLIQQIKSEGIRELFIENMSNPQMIQQIGKDTGARMGGTLYSDALSGVNGPAPTYITMFRNNVPKLKAAMLQNRP